MSAVLSLIQFSHLQLAAVAQHTPMMSLGKGKLLTLHLTVPCCMLEQLSSCFMTDTCSKLFIPLCELKPDFKMAVLCSLGLRKFGTI